MNYHTKKQLPLIKIGLLLLTALCASVHASGTSWQDKLLNKLPELKTPTVGFATILCSIDTSTIYDWCTEMNKRNAHRIGSAFMAQLWKIVWVGMLSLHYQDEILFRYALLSKLAIDILARWVHDTNIPTMLSYWPIGLAAIHCIALLNLKKESLLSWGKFYIAFVLNFSIHYIAQKCYQPLKKKIIGHQYQPSNVGYLFDLLLGIACCVVPSMLLESFIRLFYKTFPFVILLLEYKGA